MFMFSSQSNVVESSSCKVWLEDEVLYLSSKKHPPRTEADSMKLFSGIKTLCKGQKKRCMLLDLTHYQLPTLKARAYEAKEFKKVATAIAVVSRTPLGTFAATIFFTLAKPPYPVKMFTDTQKAEEWLEQYRGRTIHVLSETKRN